MLHTNPVPLDKRAPIENGSLKFNVINNTTKASVGSGTIQSQGDEDQELATVPLSTTAVTYKVYIWVDSNISLGTFNGKEYSGYLYANSVQSSDITIK